MDGAQWSGPGSSAERVLLDEVAVGGEARETAAGALSAWAATLPFEVEPKL